MKYSLALIGLAAMTFAQSTTDSPVTATVTNTQVSTITSCAPEKTDCPAYSQPAVYTTTYPSVPAPYICNQAAISGGFCTLTAVVAPTGAITSPPVEFIGAANKNKLGGGLIAAAFVAALF